MQRNLSEDTPAGVWQVKDLIKILKGLSHAHIPDCLNRPEMELAVRRQEEQYQGPEKALQRPELQEEAGDVWLTVEAEKPQVPAPGTLQAGITISRGRSPGPLPWQLPPCWGPWDRWKQPEKEEKPKGKLTERKWI